MKKLITVAVLAAGFATPAFAQEEAQGHDKAGFRVEARAVYETPTVSSIAQNNDVYKVGSAVAFGGEAGFDIAVGPSVVVGPYVTFEKSSVEASDGVDTLKVKDNLGAGLHVGYAIGSKGLIYGKVGYAKLRVEARSGNLSATESGSGFQGAVGYEHGFGEMFYGRVEFGYGDNGRIGGINFQRRHAGVALGVRF
ncbi:MAG: outer membrane beta-barrel protein [Sphingopyxis sp.]|uniref:outer membrane beta-barrel protein n=1 Tax=Sphingopyxis sp. TaxID=1908224 RepID=UPI003D6D24B5